MNDGPVKPAPLKRGLKVSPEADAGVRYVTDVGVTAPLKRDGAIRMDAADRAEAGLSGRIEGKRRGRV